MSDTEMGEGRRKHETEAASNESKRSRKMMRNHSFGLTQYGHSYVSI